MTPRRRAQLLKPGSKLDREPTPTEITRILAKVERDPATGCWLWQGYKDDNGYGQVRYAGRAQWVHRVLFSIFREPIPAGMEVDHCDEGCQGSSCCNPWHLTLLTHAENSADGARRRQEVPF